MTYQTLGSGIQNRSTIRPFRWTLYDHTSPAPLELTNLTLTASLDTVRNNYMLRTRILGYLANPPNQSLSLRQINDWVYAQVFLTPLPDPWLGLAPPDVFAAIDRNGETR